MLQNPKYYLQAENDRNTHHGEIFIEIIRLAFGVDEVVMVGHHFVFEPKEAMEKLDLSKLNEIPSADTVLFDHPIMTAVFGENALPLMVELAKVPVEQRDCLVRSELSLLKANRS